MDIIDVKNVKTATDSQPTLRGTITRFTHRVSMAEKISEKKNKIGVAHSEIFKKKLHKYL